MAASDWDFFVNNDTINSSRTIYGGGEGQPGCPWRDAEQPDPAFVGEYARIYHNAANNLEGSRTAKALVSASTEAGKYASVPAGSVIDQRFVVHHKRGTPTNPGINAYLWLCCKTEAALTRPVNGNLGYYLRYGFDGNGLFTLDLYSAGTVLEAAIAGALTIGDRQTTHLRMQVSDETTQDRIEIFEEDVLGGGSWTLLHTELVGSGAGTYRPWGATSADRNGYAYQNSAGINYGSSQAAILRYSIDVTTP